MAKPLNSPVSKRPAPHPSGHQLRGIHLVAAFEAFKGLLVLVAGFGLLHFLHHDLQSAAEELVRHTHLNPAHHYPRIFIEVASRASPGRLRFLAALAFFYTTVRLVEAYGLWQLKAWAQWFAIISGTFYLPIEIFEIAKHVTIIRIAVLVVNAFIVIYLIYLRWQSRKERRKERLSSDFATSKHEHQLPRNSSTGS
jgi:uncharacterized membrane protein (DUF2068 family)